MAITQNLLTQGKSAADVTSAATASVTPGASRLVLVAVQTKSASGDPVEPTLSGNGLTWVKVTGYIHVGSGWGTWVFRSMGASPSAGAITISFGSNTQSQIAWSVSEYIDVDTSGTNGSGAVGSTGQGFAWPGTSVSVTLSSVEAANATYGAMFAQSNTGTFTAGSGYTKFHDQAATSVTYRLGAEWRADGQEAVNFTHSTSVNLRVFGIEINAAAAAAAGAAAHGAMYPRMQRTLHQSWTVPRGV